MVPYYITYNPFVDFDRACDFDTETGMPIITESGLTIVMFNWPENLLQQTTNFITTTQLITTEQITTELVTTQQVTTVDPCFLINCQNSGVCISYEGGGTECDCSSSTHVGDFCETDPCDLSNPCLNGGSCYPGTGGQKFCQCPDGFFGPTCLFSFRPNNSSSSSNTTI